MSQRELEEISLDYLAGMVDADGCISVGKTKPSKGALNPSYITRLSVTNTNQQLLQDLKEQFGGNVYKVTKGTSKWKPLGEWVIASSKACFLLELLLPRLRIKRRQAFVCLELQSGIRIGGYNRHLSLARASWAEELERREGLYLRIKELNSGGEK